MNRLKREIYSTCRKSEKRKRLRSFCKSRGIKRYASQYDMYKSIMEYIDKY